MYLRSRFSAAFVPKPPDLATAGLLDRFLEPLSVCLNLHHQLMSARARQHYFEFLRRVQDSIVAS
ncbi:hypothetical protein PCANC_19456 [Puccinia coronata f. sp. avenae]|uniref:Uncharacterized protein n=1 Tax=Puccinia coronata f. sp. avenae TaxID=200324 RepID=A0A2N5UEZ7_9BASI|nr:hypothetical protein PCANC_24839 [Puccinia coronata f. sp. avenae]PLW36319.1 hypothetical protein PCANC_19456 [Puccinia coronata f. sp. avenae]